MVSLDQGVAILPKPILRRFNSDKIKLVSLKDPKFSWNIAIIMKKDKYVSKIIKSFIELSKTECLGGKVIRRSNTIPFFHSHDEFYMFYIPARFNYT